MGRRSSYEEQHANWLDGISGFNNSFLALGLSDAQKAELVEFLKSL